MSSNLGVGKTLELLERLKGTVRDFAARAEKLNAEFHARTGREQRLREAAAEKQAKELAAAIGEAEAAFAAAQGSRHGEARSAEGPDRQGLPGEQGEGPGGHRDPDGHAEVRTAEDRCCRRSATGTRA